jgi:hypothetical protein
VTVGRTLIRSLSLLAMIALAGSAVAQKEPVPNESTNSKQTESQVISTVVPTTQHNANEGAENGTEFWPSILGFRLKITDTLVALFTAALSIATFFLWRATRNLVKGADDTAQRQLRAYVGIESIELKCPGFDDPAYKPPAASGAGYVV